MLEEAMTEVGLDPASIESMRIVTHEEAVREHFTGSPTIRVNGMDIVPPQASEPPGLTCRLYFRADGRPSPLPDPARIRDALKHAIDQG